MIDNYPLFFICSTERTGSYLLMDLINSTGILEHVTAGYISDVNDLKSDSDEDWISHWQSISERHCIDTSKIWGTKFYSHELNVVSRYLYLNNISPLSIKWIWLRRKNKILQAISLYKSYQMNRFHFAKGETYTISEMDIPSEELSDLALRLCLGDEAWHHFFLDNKIEPYMLFYEDFENEANWKDTVLSILEFLEGFRRSNIDISTSFAKTPRGNLDEIYNTYINAKASILPVGLRRRKKCI